MIKELTKTENACRYTAWKHINRHINTYSHVKLDKPEFQYAWYWTWNNGIRQYITTPIYIIEAIIPIDEIPRIEDTLHILPPRFRTHVHMMLAEFQHNITSKLPTIKQYVITDNDIERIERAYKEKRNMIRVNDAVFTPCYIRDVIRMITPNIKKYPVYMYTQVNTPNVYIANKDIGGAVLAPVRTKDGEYDTYIKEHSFID